MRNSTKKGANPKPRRPNADPPPSNAAEPSNGNPEPSNATPPASKAPVVVRTEGQRLLIAVPGSLAQLGAAVGVAKQSIKGWRDGTSVPSPEKRAALLTAYRIPVGAWGEPPAGDVPAGAKVVPPKPAVGVLPTLVETLAVIDVLKGLLRGDTGLLPTEKAKIAGELSKTLSLRARLEEKQDLLEDRIVHEHPEFRRVMLTILDAVRPHPEVMRSVVSALEGLKAA